MSDDRRRSARVEILGRVRGHAVSLDTAVKVRDISLVGMAIETPFAFPSAPSTSSGSRSATAHTSSCRAARVTAAC